MAVISVVTQTSDPTLWQSLYDDYLGWNKPGYIAQQSNMLYKVVVNSVGEVEFHQYETLDYLDSRSTSHPKATTYNKLKGGNP